MSIRVKVCGMTNYEQVQQLSELEIDYVGFIFYKKSLRFAGSIFSDEQIDRISQMQIERIGVFVDESIPHLIETVQRWKLDFVQLHGDESPEYCAEVSRFCKVVKAFRVGSSDNIEQMTNPYKDVSFFLFDTKGEQRGGTGKKFNWEQLLVPLQHQYFLSGGISFDDVKEVVEFKKRVSKMFAVDINSKFEIKPGIKDMDRIATFVDHLKKIENE